MILANFDLSFFTSIPGMLITGGVLLLLIALVIFIATGSKKDKKGKKGETQNVEASVANNTVVATPTVDTSVATEPVVMPTVETQPVTAVQPVDTVNVVNAGNAGNAVSDNSSISTNTMDNSVPTVENAPVDVIVKAEEPAVVQTETPQVEVPKPVEPVITPMEEVQSNSNTNINANEPINVVPPTPVVSEPINSPNTEVAEAPTITIVDKEESTPQVEIPKEEPKPIYGGASPVIPKIDVGEEHRPIYGGADPLENTGAIPTINSQEIPTVTPSIPTIEKEPTVESVEPVTVTAPQVEVPTIETPSVEVPKQEVVTPTVTESAPQVEVPSTPKKEEEIESLF